MSKTHDINDTNHYVFYRYHPSLAAAGIFTVLFGLSSLFHMYQSARKRAYFMIPFIIGGLFETIGYIGRIQSSHDQWALGPFIMQTLLLLLAPALFAASIYMVLGRIILLTDGERYSLIRRTWLTKIFVGGDVFSFFLQSAGGGLMSSGNKNPSTIKTGERVILGGLLVQILFFGFFVVVALAFQIRGRAHFLTLPSTVTWRKHLNMLYMTSVFILIRSVFRVVEYVQGNAGYLLRHEAFLYIFDAVLMLAVMIAFNVVHPGDIARLLKEKSVGPGFMELSRSEATDSREHEPKSAHSANVYV